MSEGDAAGENGRPADSATFELRVLGPFALIERGSGRPVTVKSVKMRALLTFLAAAPGLRANRRKIAGMLWNLGEQPALHNLRVMLSSFRKACPDADILITDDECVALNPAVLLTDYSMLQRARQSGDAAVLRAGATAYRGEFGAGIDLAKESIDGWLVDERTRCRDAAILVIDRYARLLVAAGQHREALEHANRLIEIDSYNEATHRLVIAAEDKVSGRASALARFQQFEELLRAELDVAPEQATLDLVESLRARAETRTAPILPEPAKAGETRPAPEHSIAQVSTARRRWLLPVAAALAAIILGGSIVTWQMLRAPVVYAGESAGRVSVAILPFQPATSDPNAPARIPALEADTRLAFSRGFNIAPVEIRDGVGMRDPVSAGRALGARYVVKTTLTQAMGASQADIVLFDTGSGVSVAATTIPDNGMTIKFARELFHFISSEIILHHAGFLDSTAANSTADLLWRAEASRLRTRLGAAEPDTVALYESVLAREPEQFLGLIGLAGTLILRAAREQSSDRAADIAHAGELLRQARQQAPNLPEIIFREGMVDKLQGRFDAAERAFERTFMLDRTHWNAAAQAAHVKTFMGQFEDGYTEMESATAYLLPDMGAAETAYIAGETALVTGHPDRAVGYLDMAVAGNPSIARIHGMRAAALWMAGRHEEARIAARESQRLQPPYGPDLMAKRGRATASPRFKEAKDRYVDAYRAALAPAPASTN